MMRWMIAAVLAALAAPPAAQAAPAALLQVFDGGRDGEACVWRFVALPSGESRTYHRTDRCPTVLVWDDERGRVLYVDGNAVIAFTFAGRQVTRLAALPGSGAESLWIDATTGRLRIAEPSAEAIEGPRRLPQGGYAVSVRGRQIRLDPRTDPPDLPYELRVIHEWRQNAWHRVEVGLQPVYGAHEPPPGSESRPWRRERARTRSHDAVTAGCLGEGSQLRPVSPWIERRYQMALPGPPAANRRTDLGQGAMVLEGGGRVIVGQGFNNDLPSVLVPPLLFAPPVRGGIDEPSELTPLDLTPLQPLPGRDPTAVGLQSQGDWVAVTGWEPGTPEEGLADWPGAIAVYRYPAGEAVFARPRGFGTLLPFPGLWDRATP